MFFTLLALYMVCIGFHCSGTTLLELAPGYLLVLVSNHSSRNSSSWLRL